MRENEFEKLLLQKRDDPQYLMIGMKIDIGEQICRQMEKLNIDDNELCKKLNKSKTYITRLFTGSLNYTIPRLIEIALALDMKLKIEFIKEEKEDEEDPESFAWRMNKLMKLLEFQKDIKQEESYFDMCKREI